MQEFIHLLILINHFKKLNKMEDFKLMVVVIPTEENENDIHSNSSFVEVMECPDRLLYTLPQYFTAQNWEELPLHFSFLIDTKNRNILNADSTI